MNEQKTTLWMGELESWMDEQYIQQLWFNLNKKVLVKVIRDKNTGASAGYAFVDFGSIADARHAMESYNGFVMPHSLKQLKLNWASGGGLIDKKEDRQPEYSIFVGDLTSEVTEAELMLLFQSRYLSCKSAKIMTDPRTGMTRGYGFVRFLDSIDQQRALHEMQGFCIGSRPLRVSLATPKTKSAVSSPPLPPATLTTTVFVGGLLSSVREDELRQYFQPFGEIVHVKIPPNKGCGFVQYLHRSAAELAIQRMNGFQIGHSRIRLSWGRSQSAKSPPPSLAMSPSSSSSILSPLSSCSITTASLQSLNLIRPPLQQRQQLSNEYDFDTFSFDFPNVTDHLFNDNPLSIERKQPDPSQSWKLRQIYAL
ncbi:hypothetical protein K501DRAFT_329596 [Backusella circina FSU 941]|nr:hypothetical protein K501DRAFT_329596 [Backusella circina FSU 941]